MSDIDTKEYWRREDITREAANANSDTRKNPTKQNVTETRLHVIPRRASEPPTIPRLLARDVIRSSSNSSATVSRAKHQELYSVPVNSRKEYASDQKQFERNSQPARNSLDTRLGTLLKNPEGSHPHTSIVIVGKSAAPNCRSVSSDTSKRVNSILNQTEPTKQYVTINKTSHTKASIDRIITFTNSQLDRTETTSVGRKAIINGRNLSTIQYRKNRTEEKCNAQTISDQFNSSDNVKIKMTSIGDPSHSSNTTEPTVSVCCDGITLTTHVEETERLWFNENLNSLPIELTIKHATKIRLYRQCRSIYRGDRKISSLYFDPIDPTKNFTYLHINPAKLDGDDCTFIMEMMRQLLREPWDSIVGRSNISAMDVAVDAIGVSLDKIVPMPRKATRSGYFLKFFDNGGTRLYIQGTDYIGHETSERHARVYDKGAELEERLKVKSEGPLTRIEVQAAPRFRSKKGLGPRSCTVRDLHLYSNPLKMLSITDLPKEPIDNSLVTIATALSAYIGSTAVLGLLKDKSCRSICKDHLNTMPSPWWKPEQHWADFLRALDNCPLFLGQIKSL